MKAWPGLPLLLALLLGCARTTVAPVVSSEQREQSSYLPSAGNLPAAPTKKTDPPLKEIAKPRDNPEIIRTNERGIIRGVVRWEGAAPNPATPRLQIDPATQGIAQTAVWLLSARNTTSQPPTEPVRLSVERDEYRPHIVLAQKGSTLELGTVEDRADFQASGAATFSETIQRGDRRTFPLSSPGLIEVRSQLQPKRTPAYIWVLDGAPGTLTAADGQFRLPPVSAGEYDLVLWHEGWPTNEAAPHQAKAHITLGASDGAEVRWTLTAH
jgi:hypothetical protein